MKEIDNIIDEATSNSAPVSGLLMKCLRLAGKLKNAELKAWVDKELRGYGPNEPLPPYRIHSSNPGAIGVVVSRGQAFTNPYEPKPSYSFMREPVAQYEGGKNSAQIGVISGVRLRVVEELSAIQDSLGRSAGGDIVGRDVHVAIPSIANQYNFYGNNNAVGNRASVTANTYNIAVGDRQALTTALSGLGISDQDITDLQADLQADASTAVAKVDEDGFGERTGRWLARTAGKLARAGFDVGMEVGKEMLKDMLKDFLGIPRS